MDLRYPVAVDFPGLLMDQVCCAEGGKSPRILIRMKKIRIELRKGLKSQTEVADMMMG